jgi:hypothetical protein
MSFRIGTVHSYTMFMPKPISSPPGRSFSPCPEPATCTADSSLIPSPSGLSSLCQIHHSPVTQLPEAMANPLTTPLTESATSGSASTNPHHPKLHLPSPLPAASSQHITRPTTCPPPYPLPRLCRTPSASTDLSSLHRPPSARLVSPFTFQLP